MSRVWDAGRAVVEKLEGRTMMAASPLAISQVQMAGGGTELRVQGLARNNKITLVEQDGQFLVTDNGSSQSVSGPFHDIRIFGGAGNDSIIVDSSVTTNCFLYGGAGRNVMQAGSGNATLDCVGSDADVLSGGAGSDSFWMDGKASERITNLTAADWAGGAIHRVRAIYTSPSTQMAVNSARARARAPEPGTTNAATYQDFSNYPLFSAAGPLENDVIQGQVGDCFFLSVLSSVARIDPNKISQSILDMGSGNYLVEFSKGSSNVFVRVDDKLPVLADGQLDYAGLGAGDSIWVAIMEKAYAVFHGPTASYASIDGGWMDQVYSALGELPKSSYGGAGAVAMMALVASQISNGESVTYGTLNNISDNAPLIGGHAYSVDSVLTDTQGNPIGLVLRNPWGIDGAGNDGNDDGYVTVTAEQAYDCLAGTVAAFV